MVHGWHLNSIWSPSLLLWFWFELLNVHIIETDRDVCDRSLYHCRATVFFKTVIPSWICSGRHSESENRLELHVFGVVRTLCTTNVVTPRTIYHRILIFIKRLHVRTIVHAPSLVEPFVFFDQACILLMGAIAPYFRLVHHTCGPVTPLLYAISYADHALVRTNIGNATSPRIPAIGSVPTRILPHSLSLFLSGGQHAQAVAGTNHILVQRYDGTKALPARWRTGLTWTKIDLGRLVARVICLRFAGIREPSEELLTDFARWQEQVIWQAGPQWADPWNRITDELRHIIVRVQHALLLPSTDAAAVLLFAGFLGTTDLLYAAIHCATHYGYDPTHLEDHLFESSRLYPSVSTNTTITGQDQEMFVMGTTVQIPRGTPLVWNIAAANMDASVYPDPWRFDPTRPNVRDVLSFNAGDRQCPGKPIAMYIVSELFTWWQEDVSLSECNSR
jgi:hypothetical protein